MSGSERSVLSDCSRMSFLSLWTYVLLLSSHPPPDVSVSSYHGNESILNVLSQLTLQLMLGVGSSGHLKQFCL